MTQLRSHLSESDIEYILSKYPELIEPELTLKGRQVSVLRKRADLVFTDKFSDMLIVEVKKGVVRRKDVAQIFEYEALLGDENNPTRLMLIGNIVPIPLRKSLERHGMEWRELPQRKLLEHLKTNDKKLYDKLLTEKNRDPSMMKMTTKQKKHQDFIIVDKSKYNVHKENKEIWEKVKNYCEKNIGKVQKTFAGNEFKISEVADDYIMLQFNIASLKLEKWRFINLFEFLCNNKETYFNLGSYQGIKFRSPGLDDFLKQVEGNLNGKRSIMYILTILGRIFSKNFDYINKRPQMVKFRKVN